MVFTKVASHRRRRKRNRRSPRGPSRPHSTYSAKAFKCSSSSAMTVSIRGTGVRASVAGSVISLARVCCLCLSSAPRLAGDRVGGRRAALVPHEACWSLWASSVGNPCGPPHPFKVPGRFLPRLGPIFHGRPEKRPRRMLRNTRRRSFTGRSPTAWRRNVYS